MHDAFSSRKYGMRELLFIHDIASDEFSLMVAAFDLRWTHVLEHDLKRVCDHWR
jgi:hypothetical protein